MRCQFGHLSGTLAHWEALRTAAKFFRVGPIHLPLKLKDRLPSSSMGFVSGPVIRTHPKYVKNWLREVWKQHISEILCSGTPVRWSQLNSIFNCEMAKLCKRFCPFHSLAQYNPILHASDSQGYRAIRTVRVTYLDFKQTVSLDGKITFLIPWAEKPAKAISSFPRVQTELF